MSKVWQNPGGGVRVHAALQDLGPPADDHPQYHNDARGDARYTQRANNLSDLSDAAVARTNLGLSAGGAGDIWVQLAGDLMSGTLQIDVPTLTNQGLILRSTDDSPVTPIFEVRKADNVTKIITMRTTHPGTAITDGFLTIVGTLPTTPSATVTGVDFTITGAGSASQTQRAMSILLAAGYTGSSQTAGLVVRNLTNGTGTSVFSGIANIGIAGTGAGNGVVPVGVNIGVWARGGETSAAAGTNYGVFAFANTAHNNATNIGVAGFAVNGGASPKIIGGYFGLQSAVPTYTSSALIADNGTQPYPVFLARDNGTIVLEIVDGGLVNIKSGTHSGGSTAGFLTVAGILPAAPSNTVFGVDVTITGAGSASQIQRAMSVGLSAGYTGSSATTALVAANLSAGTGTTVFAGVANIGVVATSLASTTGTNVGIWTQAGSPTGTGGVYYGIFALTNVSKNNATHVGIAAFGYNGGAAVIQLGGYFGLNNSLPTYESSALIADNALQSTPIFLGRDNGTTVFEVLDGGLVNIRNGTHSGGSTAGFLTVTGTLPAAPSNTVFGVDFSITGAGSASQEQYAFRAVMNAGYTGSSRTIGASLQNLSAGTGASLVIGSAGTPTGNIGFAGLTVSTTTGYNVGLYGEARSGNVSIGLYGKAVTAKNSATNIGVLGNGLNTGSTPIQIGGYFSLNSSDPTFESAALIADNGSQASPIFLARDNGTTAISIVDGGHLTFANAINIVAGTGTGTKIGTGTTQKLGFWNATPIVQPATGGAAATFVANTSDIADDSATFDGYTIGQVVKALRNTGMLA